MYIVFYKTNDVFESEELLQKKYITCEVVPTPVQDKAYCGVCLKVETDNIMTVLNGFEYKIVE